MVGGGRGGNIGRSHRTAALMDGRWDVVAGMLSRNPETAAASAADWLIDPDRSYTDVKTMAAREAAREDRIDAVTICTPNNSHHAIACTFLDRGFHVICDKPLTTSMEDALDLVRRTREAGVVFAITHTYSGYPMVRMARDMIAAGDLGEIRSVAVEYVSQYQAELGDANDWQNDPARSGPLGVVAGTGTHAHHIAEFVTGLRLAELSADLSTLVPGHRLEDHATMHLRFDNGARGYLWNTTIALGSENSLSFRVYGSKGGLAWAQEHPNHMIFTRLNDQPRILSRGGFHATASAIAATRTPSGHPEGYLEAFANLYSEIGDAILADGASRPFRPSDYLFPTVEDGARGVRFMFAALESSRLGSRFVDARYNSPP
jgi:predicted dehydrogenase